MTSVKGFCFCLVTPSSLLLQNILQLSPQNAILYDFPHLCGCRIKKPRGNFSLSATIEALFPFHHAHALLLLPPTRTGGIGRRRRRRRLVKKQILKRTDVTSTSYVRVRPRSRRRPVIQKAARSSRSAIRISYAEIHSDIGRRRSDAVYMSFLARLREKRLTFASLAR